MNRVTQGQKPVYLNAMSIANSLGANWQEVEDNLFLGSPSGLAQQAMLSDGRSVPAGRLNFKLDELPEAFSLWDSRNNRLLYHCLKQFMPELDAARDRYGAHRIGVVLGTSTSGIERSEWALKQRVITDAWPNDYRFERQELGDPAMFAAALIGATGPRYSISTACTSGSKAMASAARLLRAGICDAVVTGGVDTLCGLTLNGFSVLDSMASERCNPFSKNRNGINIGEGGALFLMTHEEAALRLAGYGESADAHHLSAPDPDGNGARLAIEQALAQAQISPSDIGYLNLHGTATRLNDAMEALVTHDIFGTEMPCSSTKAMTGHMLGAAGANEAGFIAMALSRAKAPPHLWDGEVDPSLPVVNLAKQGEAVASDRYMMSCSYAFGGNNSSLILARA